MKRKYALLVAGIFLIALFAGCFGGQPEETASVDINVSEDIKEVENLQKQVKEQSEQLQKMQSDLKVKKASKSAASTEEVKKLEEQIDVQQKAIVQTSKKVTTVKAEKGKYVWAMFRSQPSHDFYNGYNITPPLDFKWKFKATAGGFKASPIMDAENIYVGSTDSNFYAIEKGTGVKAWNTQCTGQISSGAALYGNALYFGTEGGVFYALSPSTGKILWQKKLGGPIQGSSAAVYSGTVYVGCMDNNVYAMNRSTGEILWKFTTQMPVVASPMVANGMVYIGSLDANMYALDVDTGKVVWQYAATKGIASTAAENEGTLIFGSDDKKIYAVNSLNGSVKWAFQAEGWITAGVIKDGVFFTGSNDRNIYAISADSGKLLWKTPCEGKVLTTPFIVNNLLFIAAGKEVLVLDTKTGEKKWSQKYDFSIMTSLIGEDAVVYFGDTDSSFFALETTAK
jgi:outer membrane protein assembly factor BamB